MNSKDLGLPIEYQLYPEYFDQQVDIYSTQAKNNVIEECLDAYGIKTVLDMTCGTGAQVLHLAKHGYHIVGSDFSPGLLKIAREKALAQNITVDFIDGDVRNLYVGQFDAVITIDNAIGHLTKNDFEKALNNINKNLQKNGFYIFDILNLEAMTDNILKADSERMSDEKIAMDGTILRTLRHSTIDRKKGYLTSVENIVICKNQEQTTVQNTCTLKIYTINDLEKLLTQNNFIIREQHKVDAYTFKKDPTGYSILTVAQKR